jgi:hypothetical protein
MGARTNFELRDEKGSVWLYSHWGGDSKVSDLANALAKAEPRWVDSGYGMRIVASQLIGEQWDGETGYGLSSYEQGEEQFDPICVDFRTKTVSYQDRFYAFDVFVNLFKSVLTPTA